MANRMEFPKTIKEFIDDNKFKDTKEIYTNGSELIQVYRVEQALEHYDYENRIAKLEKEIELYKKAINNSIMIKENGKYKTCPFCMGTGIVEEITISKESEKQ